MNVKSHHTTEELQTLYRREKNAKACSENTRGISGKQRVELPRKKESKLKERIEFGPTKDDGVFVLNNRRYWRILKHNPGQTRQSKDLRNIGRLETGL